MHTTPSNELGDAAYVEGYLSDDETLVAARGRAAEFGCTPLSAAAGAALRFLAATLQARAVVEIGTGAGVSGLHLLRGMAPDGVLTSIDIEPEYHRAARKAFLEAGFPPGRTRLIMGRALDVLPRLTHGGYDLVFVDSARLEYPSYYEKGVALLRPGARRLRDEFLPKADIDPSNISGLPELMAQAVTFRFMSAPLTGAQLGELIQLY